jgi:hypothetical protein
MIVRKQFNKENMTVTTWDDQDNKRVWHGFTGYVGQQFVEGQYLIILFVEDSHEGWVLSSLKALDDFMRYWADSEDLPIRQYGIFIPIKIQQ